MSTTEVDDLCAIDGIHAAGFRVDSDFDASAAKRLNIKIDSLCCATRARSDPVCPTSALPGP